MLHVDLKEQIRRAIATEWPAFEQSHPRLAAAIDQELLIEQAADSLADDPDYRRAMHDAADAGIVSEAAHDVVQRFVTALIRSLT